MSAPSALIVAPSILAADFARLGAEVASVEAGGADWIHVDVMDGHFVPNLTIGPPVLAALARVTTLPLDVHLMIDPVDAYLDAFVAAGAAIVTVHAEACRHLDRTLRAIRDLGAKAGVALNPATPPETIAWVLDQLDLVLVMSVNPGFGGQRFIPTAAAKVAAVAALIGERPILVEVDGGVVPGNVAVLVGAGADAVVAGTSVFGAADRGAAISALRTAASVSVPA